jgi:hypothetical protein
MAIRPTMTEDSTVPSGQMATELRHQVARLGTELRGLLGADLVDVVVHGSVVLGDFTPGRSDLDLLVIVTGNPDPHVIADTIRAQDPAPATTLEVSVITTDAAAEPTPPWPYLIHVAGDRVVEGEPGTGDEDLILSYAVARAAGRPFFKADPAALIGVVPRQAILDQLGRELKWAAEHAPPDYAVLNACRALEFQETGVLDSKSSGGVWALARGIRPDLVRPALRQRQTGLPCLQDSAAEAAEWVATMAAALIDRSFLIRS